MDLMPPVKIQSIDLYQEYIMLAHGICLFILY